jgi:uncharacterized protein (DUF305 family)
MISKISLTILIAASWLLLSCNNNSTTNEAKTNSSNSQIAKDTISKMDNTGLANGLMISMNSMMDRMRNIKITGDFDIDFANMMIEHHQGAIDMSEKEVSTGKDEDLRGLAQNIIAVQKKEITQLNDFVKTYKPSGMKHGEGELEKSMTEMGTRMNATTMSGDMDKDYAAMMISHHEAAIAMAKLEIANGMSEELKKMAQKIILDQNKEIKEFKNWLENKK